MGNMTLCSRGIHYYDPEKHESCPYCQRLEQGRGGEPTMAANEGQARKGSEPTIGAPSLRREATLPRESRKVHVDRAATSAWHSEDDENGKTVFEPVVGWLVVIDGPERGRDYRIVTGRNSIGRTMTAEICIESDELMSKEHATLYYYAEINKFYIEDNRSKHGTFLMPKKDLVIDRKEIFDGTVIKMGSSVFLFKPLCSDSFSWEKKA